MRLSEYIQIISGGTPNTQNANYWNGNIPWISIKDFSNNRYIRKTEKQISEEGLSHSATKLLNEHDIIISARGTVGCLGQILTPMAFNQSCYGLRSISCELLQDYLYYWLLGNKSQFLKNVHGAVFDTITKQTFSDITINMPNIEYQQHIVDTNVIPHYSILK